MLFIYNIFIRLYYGAILIASLWNKKAAEWINGRRSVFEKLEQEIKATPEEDRKLIWMHCSSAGEFEQGKPFIEALKKQYPAHKILVSFFSPSGVAAARNYAKADLITYLPLDTRKNAERFIKLVKPELVVFIKYEFWYHHLSAVAFRHIPLLLVSAVFRKEQVFFKFYGKFFRRMLFLFRQIFVQDKSSLKLLEQTGITHASISGDTRFDRVDAVSKTFEPISPIERFLQRQACVVAGSTWKEDEELLKQYWNQRPDGAKLIIAPHEIHDAHLAQLKQLFPEAIYFSSLVNETQLNSKVLIIDNIGMLSRLYKYATITYVGGGFTKDGIHNILEAAVWGKPVVFGPNYKKYREATELIEAGGGFTISTAEQLKKLADNLFNDEHYLHAVSDKAKNYVLSNAGATQKILKWVQEKRLLTN